MKINRTKKFIKKFEKLDLKIQIKFLFKLEVFRNDPFEKSLNNHALIGDYKGCRSINITGDYRAIFKEYPNGTYEFVEFINIGTHSELY